MTLRNLLTTLVRHAVQPSRDTVPDPWESSSGSDTFGDRSELDPEVVEVARLREENRLLTEQCSTLGRHKLEFFARIRSFELERDEWKNLYFQHSREHQNAQELLTQRIQQLQIVALRMLREINSKREPGKEVKLPDYLRDVPEVRLASQFRERMSAALEESLKRIEDFPAQAAGEVIQ